MGTKGTRSSGTQITPKGANQGNVLVDPKTGQPVDVITDGSGIRRLAVDANITVDEVVIDTRPLDASTDNVALKDTNTGAKLKINNDGSIDSNVVVDAASGDNIAISNGVNTMAVNPDGSINVQLNGTTSGVLKSFYSEITSVAASTPTTIQSYTVPVSATAYLQKVTFSGTNIAAYELLLNATVIDKKRTWFGSGLNEEFDLSDYSKDGLPLTAGDVISIRVTHIRPDLGDFNSRLQVVEA